jgi:hypothetical protein
MSWLIKTKLEREYDSKKSELSKAIKRRNQVQQVIDNVNSSFSDNVEDINKKLNSAISAMAGGISGVAKVNSARNALSAKKETYSDSRLSDAKDQLVAERRRLNDKISSLQYETNRLKERINNGETE